MSNEKILPEENNDPALNDALSGEDNSKQNEEIASGKTAKKKTAKVTAVPAKAEKPKSPDMKKAEVKKTPKKATEAEAETVEVQNVKAKKAAPKKTSSKELTENEPKSKIKKATAAKKQSTEADQSTEEVAVSNPATEEREMVTEHAISIIMPVSEDLTASDNASDIAFAEPGITEFAASESSPVAEENLPQATIADSAQQPESSTESENKEELLIQENPVATAPETASSPVDSAPLVASSIEKITFKIKFHTIVGQSLYVSGSHELLGNNNVESSFPLGYLNDEYWSGTLEIPPGQYLPEDISYRYILKDVDGTTITEGGEDKVLQPATDKIKELLLVDFWNSSALVENTFYTEPFQKVLLKENFTAVDNEAPESITHIFKVKAPLLTKGQTLCITGSIPELGEWDIEKPLLLSRKQDEVWFTTEIDLTNSVFPFAYKYGVFDVNTNQFLQYEDGKNRILNDNAAPEKLTIVSDGFAILPNTGFKGAGVAIPVFSLRSEKSYGVGEFADMKALVDWAKIVGLKLIQILPINDTSATHTYVDSYPYAAVSAFALHPIYLHLPLLVEKDNSLLSEFLNKQQELNSQPTVDYVEVMAAKWSFIKHVFPQQKQQVFESKAFTSFFNENKHWLVPYATFSYLKEKNNTSDFNQWPTNSTFDADEINQLAATPIEADELLSVNYYVQFHLHLQLMDAVNYAHKNGIILKGDIPIGIYRYSCDAWQEPSLFNMDMQAGAPPDDFAVKGQNWGFPTYNWQRMRENGFTWWKNRFKQMSYYFDAFRIDHILGFFRIWSIPINSVEGIMGHFVPAVPVLLNEFVERGISFDAKRFTMPYITDRILSEIFGNDSPDIISQFLDTSLATEYKLKPEFDTQLKVETYFSQAEETEQNKKIKTGLFDLISNVILFEAEASEGKGFHFRIAMDSTRSFLHLDGHTQYLLKQLYIDYFFRRQDEFWRKEAMLKLPELKKSTNMLICGEDLGMVPASVPGVMKELAILSLEIQRMPKDLLREFFHPNNAPYLSVVTPSTHDMSTVRGWWEEDRAVTQRFFNDELGQWGTAPYFCEPWINRIILMQHLYSPAMWSIFQLQDLLGISGSLRRENPHEERINIPANPKHYWRYRMHLTLETLINETEFNAELRSYVSRSGR